MPSGDLGIRCAIGRWWDQMCHLVMVGLQMCDLVILGSDVPSEMVGSDVPSGDGGIRCAIW